MGGERTDGNHIYGCVLHNSSAGDERDSEEAAKEEERGGTSTLDPV